MEQCNAVALTIAIAIAIAITSAVCFLWLLIFLFSSSGKVHPVVKTSATAGPQAQTSQAAGSDSQVLVLSVQAVCVRISRHRLRIDAQNFPCVRPVDRELPDVLSVPSCVGDVQAGSYDEADGLC